MGQVSSFRRPEVKRREAVLAGGCGRARRPGYPFRLGKRSHWGHRLKVRVGRGRSCPEESGRAQGPAPGRGVSLGEERRGGSGGES